YIVQKYGVFRTKHIIAIPDIAAVHMSPYALRITLKDNSKVYMDLKQVRKKRDLEKIKNKIKEIAAESGFALSESTANRP
ncbi:MAG: hypothetical protein LPK03_15275, partial [Pontibacter sp.]|nr:hypothetical protein [Pontibacter sp.]